MYILMMEFLSYFFNILYMAGRYALDYKIKEV